MRISNLVEVDEDIFQCTIEHDNGAIVVTTFHGYGAFARFIHNPEDATDGRDDSRNSNHDITSFGGGRATVGGYPSLLRH